MKLKEIYPLYLANEAQQSNADLEVTDKFTGKVAFRCAQADAATIDAGIDAAVEAAEPMAQLPSYAKRDVLQHCISRFQERFNELAYALCVEAGKPIADSEGEVTRLIDTFRIAAEEAMRNYGESSAARYFRTRQRLYREVETGADRTLQLYLTVQLSP